VGSIKNWANENGHQMTGTKTFESTDFPDLDEIDFLVIMGGPQSAIDYQDTPYLVEEITYIQKAITANKMIIGVCLGAQLLAIATGGKALKSPHKEIGLFPIKLNEDGLKDPVFSQFNQTKIDTFHWHSDMCIPSTKYKILASTDGCPNQVFSNGKNIYGLQCHFEFTKFGIEDLVKNSIEDFEGNEAYVTTAEKMLAFDTSAVNLNMHRILEAMINLNQ